MSRLYIQTEAQQWLNEYMGLVESKGSLWAGRNIRRAAEEQRANLEAVKRRGYNSEIQIPQYESCVEMLESAAKQFCHCGSRFRTDEHGSQYCSPRA